MIKKVIQTENAPEAIGAYSQAIRSGNVVYLSGQIGLNPITMEMKKDIEYQIHQVLQNLDAVAASAGGSLSNIVKLNIYLTDLNHFNLLNEIMACYFTLPYPARAAIGVSSLPRSALVEIDGVMILE
ncbi:MAG TPA: RidA family protein [Syntrophales bacterium]|nr:RidA family protein [Syntrophales bacterium]